MSKKSTPDKTEKLLEDYADVFADIINVLVYDGQEVVKKQNLLDGPTASMYKAAEGHYGQKERDVCKYDAKNGVTYALYGLENQTGVSNIMPVRCMGYDYGAYDKNIRTIKAQNTAKRQEADYAAEIWPDQKLYPAVTIVLYFGTTAWDGPLTLREMLRLPEELKSYVPDYHINLVQVAFLSEEIIEKFQSDFRIIAEYFRAKRLGKEREASYTSRGWIHVAELMEFFHTFTNDRKYKELKDYMVAESRKGEVNMCTLLESMLEEGKEKGIALGIEEGIVKGIVKGRAEARFEAVLQLMNSQFSKEMAMEILEFTADEMTEFEKWKNNKSDK